MNFNEKLQTLRKQKGLTQEELAQLIFVSRTAISKWESGRGYPNIDSLKRIAELFSISLDELLSSNELLNIAEEDGKQKQNHLVDLMFGLVDICASLLLFLPFFAQRSGDVVGSVSLLQLNSVSPFIIAVYYLVIIALVAMGITTLALQNCQQKLWLKIKIKLSLALSVFGTLSFIAGLQPYAAIYLFIFLIIKVMLLTKKQ